MSDRENDCIWAYLTFSKDEEAYRAVTNGSKLDEIDVIQPANTWSQPSVLQAGPEPDERVVAEAIRRFDASSNGSQQNQDLLRKLLSLSTKSNSVLLKEALNRILPSVRTFDFQLTGDNGTVMPLNEVRTILRCIGQHISELGIYFRFEKYPTDVNRYFDKMCQYVGPNLNAMRLKYFPPTVEWLERLKPLLGRIERLVLTGSNYDFDYDIDFQLYCPNLRTLKISMNLNGTLLSKKQPKMERFSNLQNQFMEERLVLEFMKNNPQLLYLRIEANDCNNLLKQIPEHLTKLEKLCLYQGYPNITANNLGECVEPFGRYIFKNSYFPHRTIDRNEAFKETQTNVPGRRGFGWNPDLFAQIPSARGAKVTFMLRWYGWRRPG